MSSHNKHGTLHSCTLALRRPTVRAPISEESRNALADILPAIARLFTSCDAEAWVRVREKVAPTGACEWVHANAMTLIHQVVGRLAAHPLGKNVPAATQPTECRHR